MVYDHSVAYTFDNYTKWSHEQNMFVKNIKTVPVIWIINKIGNKVMIYKNQVNVIFSSVL